MVVAYGTSEDAAPLTERVAQLEHRIGELEVELDAEREWRSQVGLMLQTITGPLWVFGGALQDRDYGIKEFVSELGGGIDVPRGPRPSPGPRIRTRRE